MFVGSDPDALDRFASTFVAQVERLRAVTGDVDRAVHSTSWSGDDAWGLRNRWNQGQRQRLESCQQLLTTLAGTLHAQAKQQRDASRPVVSGGHFTSLPTITPQDQGDESGSTDDPRLAQLVAVLAALGLGHAAIDAVLAIAKPIVESGKFTPLLEFLSKPGLASFVDKLGTALGVADVVVTMVEDFAAHDSLPFDERMVHAATVAAIDFGKSTGAELAGEALGAALGSVVPVGGTIAGAALGKAAGFAIGWGLDQLDEATGASEQAADLMVDGYRWAKDHADDVADLARGAVDAVSDAADAVGDTARDVIDGAGQLVQGAGQTASQAGGAVKDFVTDLF